MDDTVVSVSLPSMTQSSSSDDMYDHGNLVLSVVQSVIPIRAGTITATSMDDSMLYSMLPGTIMETTNGKVCGTRSCLLHF